MAVLVYLVLFLALTGCSSASYCVCKDGQSDAAMQKVIDFACGSGADCTPILQNGACYNPNTVKDHCSYAANSYYQKKVSAGATCDFSGAAILTASPPTGVSSTCVYPSGSSTTGTPTTTPTTGTPTTTTPTTTPTTGTPTTTTPTGTTTTTPTPSVFGTGTGTGLGPTGSGFDNSGNSLKISNLVYISVGVWWVSSLVLLWA